MLQFEWMNENSIEKSGDCWKIFASPKSDFFCNNETVSYTHLDVYKRQLYGIVNI